MSDSNTPETDSVTRSSDETPWTPWVCAGHANRLERERDEARMELVIQRNELMRGQKEVMETLIKLRERLAAVTHPDKNEQKEEAK